MTTLSRKSSLLSRLAMPLVMGVMAIGGAELTARQFYRADLVHDPEIGYLQSPGIVKWSSEANASSTWTVHGLRRSAPPRADQPSILVVGDSITEALQVDDGLPFPDRLEQKLSGIQVLNAGRSTMSTADYISLAPVWRLRFAPAWTIVQVRDTDFTTDAFDQMGRSHFNLTGGVLKLVPIVPPPVTRFDFRLRQHSMLLMLIYLRFSEARNGVSAIIHPPESAGAHVAAPQRDYPVEEIVDLLDRAYNHRLTIAVVASYDPKDPLVETDVDRRVLSRCRSLGLSCVTSRVRYHDFQHRGTAPFGFPTSKFNTGHLNAEGHEALADVLAEEMKRLPIGSIAK